MNETYNEKSTIATDIPHILSDIFFDKNLVNQLKRRIEKKKQFIFIKIHIIHKNDLQKIAYIRCSKDTQLTLLCRGERGIIKY